jgi:hypothetical protein
MTIYVDDMRLKATVGSLTARWSHLMAGPGDDVAELHAFAARIGLRRSWFQGPPKHHPHYDVTDTKRQQAIREGAKPITWREAGEMAVTGCKAEPAPPAPVEPAKPDPPGRCSIGLACGRTDTRPYPCGPRCPDHTPARLAGQPEPDSERYCAPGRCYCGGCESWGQRMVPGGWLGDTVVDIQAIASGKRRVSLARYREAQGQVAVIREREEQARRPGRLVVSALVQEPAVDDAALLF